MLYNDSQITLDPTVAMVETHTLVAHFVHKRWLFLGVFVINSRVETTATNNDAHDAYDNELNNKDNKNDYCNWNVSDAVDALAIPAVFTLTIAKEIETGAMLIAFFLCITTRRANRFVANTK